jgi:hypothetical protein
LDYWVELAKLLERGKFNALFLADNFGSHDVYKDSHAPAIKAGAQWPLYDPFMVRNIFTFAIEFHHWLALTVLRLCLLWLLLLKVSASESLLVQHSSLPFCLQSGSQHWIT